MRQVMLSCLLLAGCSSAIESRKCYHPRPQNEEIVCESELPQPPTRTVYSHRVAVTKGSIDKEERKVLNQKYCDEIGSLSDMVPGCNPVYVPDHAKLIVDDGQAYWEWQ